MIVGIGTDVLEVARMERELRTGGSAFRDQLFTPGEIATCEGKRYPARHYAARFAAKEAVFKALALEGSEGLSFREVEVGTDARGKPRVELSGHLAQLAGEMGADSILVSLSHTEQLATATVVLESSDGRALPER